MADTREEMARAIDPYAFKDWQSSYDYEMRQSGDAEEATRFADWSGGKRKAGAFEKADAALAVLRPGARFTVDGVECVAARAEPTTRMLAAGQEAWITDPLRKSSTLYRAMLRACEEKP